MQRETKLNKGIKTMDSKLYIKLLNEIKELNEKIDQLQTFKDNARCNYDNCDNKAQHSDGSNLWCSECWEHLEVIYPDSELI